jgi:uncharacterized membrane protein
VYATSVAIHVVAAIIGFGATFAYPVIQLVAQRRDPAALQTAMATILALSHWVAVPATGIVGITGIFQVADGPYDLGEAWVWVGAALYAFVMLVGFLVLAPAYKRQELLEAVPLEDPRRLPDYRAALRLPRLMGPVVAGAIVATAVLMEVKPG